MKNLELFDVVTLNSMELQIIDGGVEGPGERGVAGFGLAVTGTTCLAIAAGPVGWTLLAIGTLAMVYTD